MHSSEQNGLRSTGINLLIFSLKPQPFCMAFPRFWRISEKLPQRLNKEIRNKKIDLDNNLYLKLNYNRLNTLTKI